MLLYVCVTIWLFINVDKQISDTNHGKIFFSRDKDLIY